MRPLWGQNAFREQNTAIAGFPAPYVSLSLKTTGAGLCEGYMEIAVEEGMGEAVGD